MKEIICICCPKGCRLMVDEHNDYAVTGNNCVRGEEYGRKECIAPVRVVTSTVKVLQGELSRCPVKTKQPIPKGEILTIMDIINQIKITAPIHVGDVVVENIGQTGADLVATRTIQMK